MNASARILANMFLLICLLTPGAATTPQSQARKDCDLSDKDVSEKVKRRREVECLRAILRDEGLRRSDPERVFRAMRRLGELRSVIAVGDLIGLLTLKRVFDWETPDNAGHTGIEETIITAANRYPAVDALISIGKPALPALVDVIGSRESGSVESENAVFAVFMIFRARPERAAEFLRMAADRAHSSEAALLLLTASKNRMLSPTRTERRR